MHDVRVVVDGMAAIVSSFVIVLLACLSGAASDGMDFCGSICPQNYQNALSLYIPYSSSCGDIFCQQCVLLLIGEAPKGVPGTL